MTPTDDLLKRAKAMLAAATPGPWLVPEPATPMTCIYSDETNVCLLMHRQDAHLVAFARNELPELVAAIESDRALLRRFVDAWENWPGEEEMDSLIDEARARVGGVE